MTQAPVNITVQAHKKSNTKLISKQAQQNPTLINIRRRYVRKNKKTTYIQNSIKNYNQKINL